MLNPVTVANDLADLAAIKAPGTNGVQTANHANSTSPTSASLSNTAAGYTTLGGRWQFAAVAGAATDYALFAYQVPSTHKLVIKGIYISAINTGAAVATTATVLDWSIAVNSTAVSLATTDSDPVYAPRRAAIGTQGFLVSAGIGTAAADINRTFEAGLVCQPSRYVHIIVQSPVGTATGSQVLRGDVFVDAYFEPV